MSSRRRGETAPEPMASACNDYWVGAAQLVTASGRSDRLFKTVETEIIPRLVMLHRQDEATQHSDRTAPATVRLGHAEVAEFTSLVLKGQEGALVYLKALSARGVRADSLCLDLLGPCARRLGELWCDDLCDFTEVTIGLGRLQSLLRGLSAAMAPVSLASEDGHRALFALAPGDQHTLGLSMVCDFFRTSGWSVWGESPSTAPEVLATVREHPFDVIGFAVGSDRHIGPLTELIVAVRRLSMNPRIGVMLGGPMVLECPQLAALVGADATASDARQAILAAQRLVATRDEGR